MRPSFCTDCDSYLSATTPLFSREVSATDIFGPHSELAAEIRMERPQARPTDPLQAGPFEVFVLCLLLLYSASLYYFRGAFELLFKLLTHSLSREKLLEQQPHLFQQLLRFSRILGLCIATGVVSWGVNYWAGAWLLQLPDGLGNWFFLPVLGCVLLVMLYRWFIVRLLALFTNNTAFFRSVGFLSQITLTAAYLVIAPLFSLFVLHESAMLNFGLYAILGITSLFYLSYISRSYRFFVEQNVSTLQWFLYLCTVEIFPISFFILIGIRNFS